MRSSRQVEVLLGESRLLDPCEWLVELCQGLATPEIERPTERGRSFVSVTVRKRLAAIVVELLEAAQIERVPVEVDDVARRTRAQQPIWQLLAQLRDEDLHHLPRRLRHVVTPEVVDEPIHGNDAIGVQAAAAPASAFCLPPAA